MIAGIKTEPFTTSDLGSVYELQPPTWADIRHALQYFVGSQFCRPIKIMLDGKIIGLGNSLLHEDTAWLAAIIVHPRYRNQGLGKYITQVLIEQAQSLVKTIYLDATEFGYPVYSKLGFEVETEYIHLKGALQAFKTDPCIVPFQEMHHEAILNLDRKISGENRRVVLNEQLAQSFVYLKDGEILGAYFPTLRDGFIMAQTSEAGIALMKLRLNTFDFAIFPADNLVALAWIQSLGFEAYRNSRRMRLGAERSWQPECMYNRISGQLG